MQRMFVGQVLLNYNFLICKIKELVNRFSRLPASLLLLLTIHWHNAFSQKNDLEEHNLNGSVKSVLYTSYKAVLQGDTIIKGQHQWESNLRGDRLIIYNNKGYLIEEYDYNASRQLASFYRGILDTNGREYEGIMYDVEDNDTVLVSKTIFKYDDNGNQILEHVEHHGHYIYENEDSILDYHFIYDNNNQKIKQYGGRYGWYTVYIYNKVGWLTEEQVYDSTNHLIINKLYKYNKFGNRIEDKEVRIDSKGEKTTKCSQFKWSKKGYVSEYIECDANCKPLGRTLEDYDDLNRRIKYQEVNSYGELVVTYTYSYKDDKYGNWVQQYVYREGKPVYIIEREIKYY
ncbi:MAG: hypothetical protein SFW35_08025 [Chitinophagales bacterium]|nr:hypothetical protein [Chitinophagales bacterium]